MAKHLGSGAPHGSNAIYNEAGKLVILHGRQTDGTYGTRYFDPTTGAALVKLGNLGDGSYGIAVMNLAGRVVFRVDGVNGQSAPYLFAPGMPSGLNGVLNTSTPNSFRPGTTSATFVELWRADFFAIGNQVDYDLTMFANSGNMSWQIKSYQYISLSTTGTPIVVASGTETTNVQRTGTFTIDPLSLLSDGSNDVAGRFMTVRVEAKKNSGSFTVDIAQNGPFYNHH